jgi:hypothetical protein
MGGNGITSIQMELTGLPLGLIMHNGRLANPFDEYTQRLGELTSAKKKTLEQHRKISKLEWKGSLYLNPEDDKTIGFPADVIWATGYQGAKNAKLGEKYKASVVEADGFFPLKYDGAKDPDKLFEDKRFVYIKMVRIGRSRVPRTRPIFREWSAVISMMVIDEVMNPKDVVKAFEDAGRLKGIGDWSPRFGRFSVKVV